MATPCRYRFDWNLTNAALVRNVNSAGLDSRQSRLVGLGGLNSSCNLLYGTGFEVITRYWLSRPKPPIFSVSVEEVVVNSSGGDVLFLYSALRDAYHQRLGPRFCKPGPEWRF